MPADKKAVEGTLSMNSFVSRRRALTFAGVALTSPMIASGVARAIDDWPNKPVRYINVFPPGGPTDTLSRIVCHQFDELTGQQFIVDNNAGSGGNVRTHSLAQSAPPGYTIVLSPIPPPSIPP